VKQQQQQGKAGEDLAASVLAARGLDCGEKIGTPVITTYAGEIRGRDVYFVARGEKVSGDRHGLVNGIGVLVETKTVSGDRLVYSKLRDHQPGALSRWAEAGGIALLVWVSDYGVFVMRWPVPGFMPGTSIGIDRARELDIVNLLKLA